MKNTDAGKKASAMEYRGYYGTVGFSAADDVFFGKVAGVNSLISFEGDSVQGLRADFEGAVNDYLEMCADKGIEPEKAYKGSFNVRVSPELHKALALYSASHGKTLNSAVEEAISHYITPNNS
ncbi:MAG: type II toxin-antitoxin system HicB family antitoxin [Oscillospiraceae bacterium]|jgi:predicted HicB family RNase H-like nuclease|nr:type II toxin-antitoxin system HicB family antitoxin [Oscillospiraceae bacterium]